MSELALFGGPKHIDGDDRDLFLWPIVTHEDEEAVLSVLRERSMSGTEITKRFEREMAAWLGVEHALGYCNGTAAIQGALWAAGLRAGDEVICPSMTYWASAAPALSLGAAVNFAEIDPVTLCIDPEDIERRIGPRTKAIMLVHYSAHPCDMDRIMPIAKRRGVKVIEDASHAQGSLYKGRKCGTFGDVSVMSLMTAKSFAIGEAGMLFTSDRAIFERAVSFGFYERTGSGSEFFSPDNQITDPALARYAGIPQGGCKQRMHQMSSAVGRVQLRHYDRRIADIDAAMAHFWDSLSGTPGLLPHRVPSGQGSTMGGWYYPLGLFENGKYPKGTLAKVCAALRAEGVSVAATAKNGPLHLHPAFVDMDLFGLGKPTIAAFAERDVRQGPGSLPQAESIADRAFSVPWFKRPDLAAIDRYAAAFRKVFARVDEIVERGGLR